MRWMILAAAATLPAIAQDRMQLTMKQAVELALSPEGSPRLQLAHEIIRQTETRIAQSRAALLPNADAAINQQNFTRNLRAFGVNAPGLPVVVGPINNTDLRATVTQTVFDFSALKRYRTSQAQVDVAKAEEDAARNVVSDVVARAYLALLRADAVVETQQANVKLAESLQRLAASQKDAGTGTGIEVTRAQVQLANEQQRLLVARNDRDRAQIQLLRSMGVRMNVQVEATDRLRFAPNEAVTVDEALATAKQTRADVRVQQKREAVSKMQFEAVKFERLPSLGAYADLGGIGLDPTDLRYTRTFALSLRIPVFDGGRRDARRAESASQLRQEQIRARDLQQQVEAEVRLAFESLQSAEGQIKTAEQGVQLSENELAQARRRYEGGVGASIEVTDAQTRVARARDNQTAALFLHNLAKIELASAMGLIHKVIQ